MAASLIFCKYAIILRVNQEEYKNNLRKLFPQVAVIDIGGWIP